MIDYTGKLNNHEDYIDILNKIQKKCKYIEVVILDQKESNKLVNQFKDDIICIKKVKEWWGTEIFDSDFENNLYKIKSSKELFSFLSTFETFCKYFEYGTNEKSFQNGDYSEQTNFGIDDIAFYDKENNCLLWTTTHEGYIMVNDSII